MELVGFYLEREENKPAGQRPFNEKDFFDMVIHIMSYEEKPIPIRRIYVEIDLKRKEEVI